MKFSFAMICLNRYNFVKKIKNNKNTRCIIKYPQSLMCGPERKKDKKNWCFIIITHQTGIYHI